MTIYVTIGNSDDKLTQREWSRYWNEVNDLILAHTDHVYGVSLSAPDSSWQNACWSFGTDETAPRLLIRHRLAFIAGRYRQDSVAWTEGDVQMIPGVPSV